MLNKFLKEKKKKRTGQVLFLLFVHLYPVKLYFADLQLGLRKSWEALFEQEQDGFCSFFKEFPLLQAHS